MKKRSIVLIAAFMCLVASSGSAGQHDAKKQSASSPAAYRDPVSGMEFVLVRGGCFEMGDTFGDNVRPDELPVHEVCVDDFYLAKFPVTNAQFRKFIEASNYRTLAEERGTGWGMDTDDPQEPDWGIKKGIDWRHPLWPGDSIARRMNHPVLQVSWDDAAEFAKWLSAKTGKQYRLASEAEYEYAIRSGGKKYRYAWGDGPVSGNVADRTARKKFKDGSFEIFDGYTDGYAFTSPVGTFRPNELGLYDMTGNVWSWVEDWYGEDYYRTSPKQNPRGPEKGEYRMARGGSWGEKPEVSRASSRIALSPDTRANYLGFRLALTAR